MLNQNRKNEFLEYVNKQNKYMYYYSEFEKAAIIEDLENKDICDLNKQEIGKMYNLMNLFSLYKARQLNSFFVAYTDYCIKHKYSKTNINAFSSITMDDLQKTLNTVIQDSKILTRDQVVMIAGQALNARDSFAILCLFEGICGTTYKEITEMKIENIDVKNKTIHLLNRDLKVSSELIHYAEASNVEMEYTCFSGNINGMRKFVDNGRIYKNHQHSTKPFDPVTGRTLSYNLMNLFKEVGLNKYVKPNDVKESGKIHMIKERAKIYNMTPTEYIMSEYIDEVAKRFDCRFVRSLFLKAYESYLK